MRNVIVILAGVLGVSACSPSPICNDDVFINKLETPIDDCRNNRPAIVRFGANDPFTDGPVVSDRPTVGDNDNDTPDNHQPDVGDKRPDAGDDHTQPDDVKDKPKDTPKDKDKPSKDKKDKRDNSDANGKGGNNHDRDDHTKGGTETAEDKKGV